MKKSLIALAVAGAMTAPIVAQADATLYGSFRVALSQVEDADLDLVDDSTRIGIKGTVDLGLEDTKGLFHWEANLSTVDSNAYGAGTDDNTTMGLTGKEKSMFGERLAYIGATGSWGTALVGRQYHPHFLWVNLPALMFNNGAIGETNFLGNDYHKRVDNTAAYISPVMSGFQFAGGAVIAGEGNDTDGDFDENVDGYNIAAKYSIDALTVAASYGDVETNLGSIGSNNVNVETWGLTASYKIDALDVVARYEEQETGTTGDEQVWALGGTYTMGATSLMARYTDYEDDKVANSGTDQIAVGVQQMLGNKGRVYFEAAFNDSDATPDTSKDMYVLGYRLDF